MRSQLGRPAERIQVLGERLPEVIVDLPSTTPDSGPHLLALLRLRRSLSRHRPEPPVRIWVASNGLWEVTAEEAPAPEETPLVAACRALSASSQHLVCRHLDLLLAGSPRSWWPRSTVNRRS